MQFSDFGEKLAGKTGIGQLMDDLTSLSAGKSGASISPEDLVMLGGGNPAIIDSVADRFLAELETQLTERDGLTHTLSAYGSPGGNQDFCEAVAGLLRDEYDWDLSSENIAILNGSQSAFFLLFNLFAGTTRGKNRQVLLPMVPEYIGYEDVALTSDMFTAIKPSIDDLGNRRFKYRLDLDALEVNDSIAALCVSRPTNPTGNLLTDPEIDALLVLASRNNIPLIVDNAYGAPFPNLINSPVSPTWNKDMILTMSLSKLGLPALRTGIVVADKSVIQALTRMNAVINLSTGSFGQSLALKIIETGEIIKISREIIQPLYAQKLQHALQCFNDVMYDTNVMLHEPEGAFFLWMWFPDLKISAAELYRRLKSRGVIVVPGHHFFPGLDSPEDQNWKHRHECIRVSYAGRESDVEKGLRIISDEVRAATVQHTK